MLFGETETENKYQEPSHVYIATEKKLNILSAILSSDKLSVSFVSQGKV